MTLRQHDIEQRAKESLQYSESLRTRLLDELGKLEVVLREARALAHQIPEGPSVTLPETTKEVEVKVRRTWKVWQH